MATLVVEVEKPKIAESRPGATSEQRRMPETFSCLGQAKLQRVCVRTYVQKYRHVRKVNGS